MVLERRGANPAVAYLAIGNVFRRVVVRRGDQFGIVQVLVRVKPDLAVAGAQVGQARFRFHVDAGAANADGRGRRIHRQCVGLLTLTEYREHAAGEHTQRVDEEAAALDFHLAVGAQDERIAADGEHDLAILRGLTTSPPRMRVARSACLPLTRTSPSRLKIDLSSGSFSGLLPHHAACRMPAGVIVMPLKVSNLTRYCRRFSSSGCSSSSWVIDSYSGYFY